MIKYFLYNYIKKLENKAITKLANLTIYSNLPVDETIKEIHKMEKLDDKLIDLLIIIDKKRFGRELIKNMPESID